MIAVNEWFDSYQGEGKSAGMPCTFLRLSGCNLACGFCDSPFTWNWTGTSFQHPDKYDKAKEVHKMTPREIFGRLNQTKNKNLVLTGGEPLLQQRELVTLLELLVANHWWIEVETNGTIAPQTEFNSLINQYNCSPKTSNAGEKDNPLSKRVVPVALRKIANSGKATFKFVVQSDQDLSEIMSIMAVGDIHPNQVWLMAEGKTREEQIQKQDAVRKIAEAYKFNFSQRLHVLEYSNKRGV